MKNSLRNRRDAQKGFTLIELLVVVIIIGLLAAIAIPTFLGQRDRAHDAAAMSLVRSGQSSVEAAYVDTRNYSAIDNAKLGEIEPSINWTGNQARDNQVAYTATADGYTLVSVSQSGRTYTLTKSAAGVARTCNNGCTTW